MPKKQSTEFVEQEAMEIQRRDITPEPVMEQVKESPKPVRQFAGLLLLCIDILTTLQPDLVLVDS